MHFKTSNHNLELWLMSKLQLFSKKQYKSSSCGCGLSDLSFLGLPFYQTFDNFIYTCSWSDDVIILTQNSSKRRDYVIYKSNWHPYLNLYSPFQVVKNSASWICGSLGMALVSGEWLTRIYFRDYPWALDFNLRILKLPK